MGQELLPLTMLCCRMECKQIGSPIDVKHAIKIGSAVLASGAVDCAQCSQAVERDHGRTDANRWPIFLVQVTYGPGTGAFPVFIGQSPFRYCERLGSRDAAQRAQQERVYQKVLGQEEQ